MFKYINFLLLAILLLIFSCEEIMPVIEGCTIETACNYNADATDDDDTCVYNQGCNQWCNGDEGEPQEFDCSSECGGDRVEDNCGTCDNDSSNDCVQDCANDWGGSKEEDVCGVCDGDGIADGTCDCAGNVADCNGECGGSAVVDECGICNGPGAIAECSCEDIPEGDCDCAGNVADCNGACGGSAEVDECGECGGDGIDEGDCDCAGNVTDCTGECGGLAVVNECGECGGDLVTADECSGYGCMDVAACNYNALATVNCGNVCCFYESDCAGVCGGSTITDCAGACGGLGVVNTDGDGECCATGVIDCLDTCDGNILIDDCGVCNGENSDKDCAGICFGSTQTDRCGECGGAEACFGCNGWYMENFICDEDGAAEKCCSENSDKIDDKCILTDNNNNAGCSLSTFCQLEYEIDCDENDEFCDYDGAYIGEPCSTTSGSFIVGEGKCKNKCFANCFDLTCTEGFCDYPGAVIGSPCSTTSGSFIVGEGECKLYTTNDDIRKTGYITYNNTRCEPGVNCCEEPACDEPATLSLVYINETTIQVNYISSVTIYGFNFHIPGTIIHVGAGGVAADNSWSVSTLETGGDGVLGVDFFGTNPILAGLGILTNLTVTIDASTENLCLTGLALAADGEGNNAINSCPKYWPLTCIPPSTTP